MVVFVVIVKYASSDRPLVLHLTDDIDYAREMQLDEYDDCMVSEVEADVYIEQREVAQTGTRLHEYDEVD